MVMFYEEDPEMLVLSVDHLFATVPAALHTVAICVANEALGLCLKYSQNET